MIDVKDKHLCCGCSACAQRCPKQCITMKEDEEGFLYPQVNTDVCVDCGLCERVCPFLIPKEEHEPLKVFASKNPNNTIRLKSSSGGVFSMLADNIIHDGGVVFGARFGHNWEVVHDYTESLSGVEAFRGAKYTQSVLGESFIHVRDFLKQGRKVLFVGTPCQIAGLKRFIGKEEDNLLAVDFCCHGVPSPLVWNDYLEEVVPKGHKPISVNFRDKENGWEKYGLRIVLDNNKEVYVPKNKNPFMFAFLHNYSLRPSCYNCPAKGGKSKSDITIGDFWGVECKQPQYYNKNGVSLVLIQTEKGLDAFHAIGAIGGEATYQDTLYENGCLKFSAKEPSNRNQFWAIYRDKSFKATWPMLRNLEPSSFRQLLTRIRGIIRHITGK